MAASLVHQLKICDVMSGSSRGKCSVCSVRGVNRKAGLSEDEWTACVIVSCLSFRAQQETGDSVAKIEIQFVSILSVSCQSWKWQKQFVCSDVYWISGHKCDVYEWSPRSPILSCSSVKLILSQLTSKGWAINNSDSIFASLITDAWTAGKERRWNLGDEVPGRWWWWWFGEMGGVEVLEGWGVSKTAAPFPKLYLKMLTPSGALRSHGSSWNICTNPP